MDNPIALSLRGNALSAAYRVGIDESMAARLASSTSHRGPAVILTRSVTLLDEISAGILDPAQVLGVLDGRWADAILVVLPEAPKNAAHTASKLSGDEAFLEHVRRVAPQLADLAARVLTAIREKGVEGYLREEGGRWVNRPVNTFTLKAQPRAGNLHFTLYGNPSSYDAGTFLLRDQNSYSRGWIKNEADAERMSSLARLSHSRRAN